MRNGTIYIYFFLNFLLYKLKITRSLGRGMPPNQPTMLGNYYEIKLIIYSAELCSLYSSLYSLILLILIGKEPFDTWCNCVRGSSSVQPIVRDRLLSYSMNTVYIYTLFKWRLLKTLETFSEGGGVRIGGHFIVAGLDGHMNNSIANKSKIT